MSTGLLLALPNTLLLWRRSSGDQAAKRLGLLVFGLSLGSCYAPAPSTTASASRPLGSPSATV